MTHDHTQYERCTSECQAYRHTVSVFCGARGEKAYADEAYEIGRYLGRRKVRVVFGGGGKGSMGALADGVLVEGGDVVGYMPEKLVRPEIVHPRTPIEIVPSMVERKAKFWSDCDSYLALPGGVGTLDELFEAWTMAKLGYFDKRVAIVNSAGFYDGIMRQIRDMVVAGFLNVQRAELVRTFENGIEACDWLLS